MSTALDVGSHRLKTLRHDGERLLGRSCRSRYAVIDNQESQRTLLNHMNIPHAVCDEGLVVIGDHATDFSRLFQVPCLPLLPHGRIPQSNPPARQIIAALIESHLPEPKQSGEICCLSFPGLPAKEQAQGNTDYEFYTRLIRLQGYEPLVLTSSLAVVLAEMVGHSFTGIGINLGASSCEVSLAHLGNEIAHCSISRGGDWIDEQFALRNEEYTWDAKGNRHPDLLGVSCWKESLTESIVEAATKQEKLLCELYRELVSTVLQEVSAAFSRIPAVRDVPRPLGLVVCGGSSRIPGFDQLFRKELHRNPLPMEVSNLFLANSSDYTVARGGLIYAELETQARTMNRIAA